MAAKEICPLTTVDCTNIYGSYSGSTARDHVAGAAIDIVTSEPEMVMEKLTDLICENHWNNSYGIAPLTAKGTHLHCTDKWWAKDIISKKDIFFTTYNAESGQTDSTPCVAGGTGMNICERAWSGHRVIALSQDLVTWTGRGLVKPGQSVTLVSTDYPDDPRCNGEFEVWDSMNVRYTDRGDIFMEHRGNNTSCHANVYLNF